MKLRFEGLSGQGIEKPLEFDLPVIKVGRGEWNHLVFSDPGHKMVSRNHAEIRVEGGTVTLVDLQSSFGTYVNGEKVGERKLHPGDKVQFGTRGPELFVRWDQPLHPAADMNRTVLTPDLATGATVVVPSPSVSSGIPPGTRIPQPSAVPPLPEVPVGPGRPQPTVVVEPGRMSPGSVTLDTTGQPGTPRPTVIYDPRKAELTGPGKPAAERPQPLPPAEPLGATSAAGEAKAGGSRGIGKETMAFIVRDLLRQEKERSGASDSGMQQAQVAVKSVSKLKVLLIGLSAILTVFLLALMIQNMQLQSRLKEQEGRLNKTDRVSVDMLRKMGQSEEEVRKAMQDSEKKLEQAEKQFESFKAAVDAERKKYQAEMQELKEKAKTLEALNTRISSDRKENLAVSKQVASSSEAGIVLIYCKYILGSDNQYDSHGTGFIVSADGKVLTAKEVVEPWKFEPEIAAFMKVGNLSLTSREIYVWRLDAKVQRAGNEPDLTGAFSTAAKSLTLFKTAPDEWEDRSYTREDTGEKIPIKIHKSQSEANLAVLQMRGAGLPSVRLNPGAAGPDIAVGSQVISSGFPLGVDQATARPEQVRAALQQFGNVIKIDRPLTRGYRGAPLMLPDGSAIGLVITDQYIISARIAMKLAGL